MSPVSSITGLSSASSFSTFRRGQWCTPPRMFVDDQVTFYQFNPVSFVNILFLYFEVRHLTENLKYHLTNNRYQESKQNSFDDL